MLDELEVSEIDGLVPFLDKEEMAYLLAHLEPIRKEHEYGRISSGWDLEQLQVVYYPSLFPSKPELAAVLDLIQNSGMHDQHAESGTSLNN